MLKIKKKYINNILLKAAFCFGLEQSNSQNLAKVAAVSFNSSGTDRDNALDTETLKLVINDVKSGMIPFSLQMYFLIKKIFNFSLKRIGISRNIRMAMHISLTVSTMVHALVNINQ